MTQPFSSPRALRPTLLLRNGRPRLRRGPSAVGFTRSWGGGGGTETLQRALGPHGVGFTSYQEPHPVSELC